MTSVTAHILVLTGTKLGTMLSMDPLLPLWLILLDVSLPKRFWTPVASKTFRQYYGCTSLSPRKLTIPDNPNGILHRLFVVMAMRVLTSTLIDLCGPVF